MSILVRPVREQLEHDRLIRHLQAKYKSKRKFTVAINVGDEQVAPVKIGQRTLFPDLVLTDGRKLALLVEVESGESTNNLEALAQWVHFSRARVPFHLYVPVPFYESARRLCEANQARVSEIWTYRPASDGFDLVKVYNESPSAARGAAAQAPRRPVVAAGVRVEPAGAKAPKAPPPAAKPAVAKPAKAKPAAPSKPAGKPAGKGKPAKSAKSAKRVAPVKARAKASARKK